MDRRSTRCLRRTGWPLTMRGTIILMPVAAAAIYYANIALWWVLYVVGEFVVKTFG